MDTLTSDRFLSKPDRDVIKSIAEKYTAMSIREACASLDTDYSSSKVVCSFEAFKTHVFQELGRILKSDS